MKSPFAALPTALLCALYVLMAANAQQITPQDVLTGPIDNRATVPLASSVHPKARPEYDAGPVAESLTIRRMTLVLHRSAAQQAALDALLAAQLDQLSPQYHQWLTPEEFGSRFGLSQNDLNRLTAWLRQSGFTVDEVPKGRWTIVFSGTAGQVQSAFHTEIHYYNVDGTKHRANSTALQMPQALSPVVEGVLGINDFRPVPAARGVDKPDYGSGSTGAHFLAPSDFATIYDLNPLYAAGYNGAGQTIAIVGVCDIDPTAVQSFRRLMGIGPNTTTVTIVGQLEGNPCGDTYGDLGEPYLDVEWAGAVAPNAAINLVLSDGVGGSAQYIVNNNLAAVMSTSFADCEAKPGSGNQFWSYLWAQASSQGITSLVASGDGGAAGCDNFHLTSVAGQGLGVNGICSTPYDICVGGTEFNDSSNPAEFWSAQGNALGYIPEVAWNESATNGGSGILASSGGYSIVYPKTLTPWQTGNNSNWRGVPDVSLTAAGHDGYIICTDQGGCSLSTLGYGVGGTSAAAPSFAGIMALVVQNTGQRQGNVGPILYGMAANTNAFHDITSGNNNVPGQQGYSATPGWDPVTGLGSVDASAMVRYWPGATVFAPVSFPDLKVIKTHSGNFTQGQKGAVYTITLTNDGAVQTSGVVSVNDTLPAGLAGVSINGTGWTCTQPAGPCTRSDALASLASYPAITVTVNVSATAPLTVTNTATVSGGGDINTFSNTANDVTIVSRTPTAITLSSSSSSSIWGQPVTLTATVMPGGATGTVTFYDAGTVLGDSALSGGSAQLTTNLLASGIQSLKAYYLGDATHAAGSAGLVHQVNALPENGFQPVVNYAGTVDGSFVAIGDFNGDGKPDLVSADTFVYVYPGNGDGTFRPGLKDTGVAITSHPSGVVADFNGDGKADLAISNYSGSGNGSVSVLLGKGDGTFQPATTWSIVNYPNITSNPLSVAVGDLDGDGIPDLAVAVYNLNLTSGGAGFGTVSILLGKGDGTFQTAFDYDLGEVGPSSVAMGDFNGDSKLDLVLATSSGVSVLLGNGDGTFQTAVNYSVGSNPLSVAVGDFNGDGRPDLAVANNDSNNISILLGNGDGSFHAAVNFGAGASPQSVAVGDFNGDGYTDLVVSNSNSNNIGILLGNGDGTFQAPMNYTAGTYLTSVAVGDFNGDSRADLAVADPSVGVLLGTGAPQVITFKPIGNVNLGVAPFTVSAAASSGLPVTLASTTPAVCTLAGATVTLVTWGTCSITATQAGSSTLGAALPVTRSFAVDGASQTITFGALSWVSFGIAPFTVAATASSGLAVTFASTASAVCTVSDTTITVLALGFCSITASQPGNATYGPATPVIQSFYVTQGSQTITFTVPASVTLPAAPFALTATASSGLPVSFVAMTPRICSVTGSTVTPLAAGTCTITATQAGNVNYATATPVTRSFTINAGGGGGQAAPKIANVQNAATYQTTLGRSTYALITGSNLSTTNPGRSWTNADFTSNPGGTLNMPTSLDGTSVTIGNSPAYVAYVSPGQINIITPPNVSGSAVPVVVKVNGQVSATFAASIQSIAPSFFTWQPNTGDFGKYLIAQHSNYTNIGKVGLFPTAPTGFTTPAQPGETIILYGTGFGPTSPPIASGIETNQVYSLSPIPTAMLGNEPATVVFAGLIPGLSEVYQFNVTIPAGTLNGDQALVVTVNGTQSTSGLITVQQ